MSKHRLLITQFYRMERTIAVDVEADTVAEAIARQDEELSAPDYDSPLWVETKTLENEEVTSA